jgi:hypothetical protein
MLKETKEKKAQREHQRACNRASSSLLIPANMEYVFRSLAYILRVKFVASLATGVSLNLFYGICSSAVIVEY